MPKTPNPKGIALFLSSLVRLSKSGLIESRRIDPAPGREAPGLDDRPAGRYSCWGYNFDWQQRSELVPKGSPNIICTTFAANALLDAYERTPDPSWLESGRERRRFHPEGPLLAGGRRERPVSAIPSSGGTRSTTPISWARPSSAGSAGSPGRENTSSRPSTPPAIRSAGSTRTAPGITARRRPSDGSTISTRASISSPCGGSGDYRGNDGIRPGHPHGLRVLSRPISSGRTAPRSITMTPPTPSTSTASPRASSP